MMAFGWSETKSSAHSDVKCDERIDCKSENALRLRVNRKCCRDLSSARPLLQRLVASEGTVTLEAFVH